MPKHSALTGSNLHEWKGAASAADSTTYFADGLGSGSWDVVFEDNIQSAVGSTSETVTGLDDYAALYITTPSIVSGSNDDRHWFLQFGNSGGLTTSSVYYSNLWDYSGGSSTGDFQAETSIRCGYSYTSGPGPYGIQSMNFLVLNFNKPYYTVGGGASCLFRSQAAGGLNKQCSFLVRELKAYNQLKFTWTNTIADGSVTVMGLKG